MGVPPIQIHVMSAISGVEWEEVWTDRSDGRFGSQNVPFIGRRTYVKNKRASGRPKDLADIDALRSNPSERDEE
jgi:hypothetical protein